VAAIHHKIRWFDWCCLRLWCQMPFGCPLCGQARGLAQDRKEVNPWDLVATAAAVRGAPDLEALLLKEGREYNDRYMQTCALLGSGGLLRIRVTARV